MIQLKHTFAPLKTDVHLDHKWLYSPKCTEILKSFACPIVVITDSHVKQLIADPWVVFLRQNGQEVTLLSFPAGEESKNRTTKEKLEDELLKLQCGRDTVVIAIGGGVVTDLAGFLASTYTRGIPLVLIPTTLLGMVDAAIGGKTGVNTPFGKNLIGSFYPPSHIFIDTSTLSTLSEKEWKNGAAEIIKYGLIRSLSFFQRLVDNRQAWQVRDLSFLQQVIQESILIKQEVVESDFQEAGYRRILNFGHTIAHAIETVENYQISHGEAVAIGMLVEGYLSYQLGFLKKQELEQIDKILHLFHFSLQLSSQVTVEKMISAMAIDKKAKAKKPRFVILKEIGTAVPFRGTYCTEIEDKLLKEVLTWMLAHLKEQKR